jgi:GNAT superfamily N-acetyltransferase
VNDIVVGYYSLTVGQVDCSDATERLRKGLARHPVPIMLLARLAVHKDWQGKGVGRALLGDATLRTIQASEIAGIRALVVHAKDDAAKRSYEQFDFVSSLTDPLQWFNDDCNRANNKACAFPLLAACTPSRRAPF